MHPSTPGYCYSNTYHHTPTPTMRDTSIHNKRAARYVAALLILYLQREIRALNTEPATPNDYQHKSYLPLLHYWYLIVDIELLWLDIRSLSVHNMHKHQVKDYRLLKYH